MADENVVQVEFTGDIYDLQEKTDAAQEKVDAFVEAVKADLEAAAEAASGARDEGGSGYDNTLDPQQYDELSRSAGHASHSVSSLAKAVHLSSRVFGEKGNEVGRTAMEIRHMVHSATLAQNSIQGLVTQFQHLTRAQVMATLTNPFTLMIAGAVAAGAAILMIVKHHKMAEEAAKKASKEYEGQYKITAGGAELTAEGEKKEQEKHSKEVSEKQALAYYKYKNAKDAYGEDSHEAKEKHAEAEKAQEELDEDNRKKFFEKHLKDKEKAHSLAIANSATFHRESDRMWREAYNKAVIVDLMSTEEASKVADAAVREDRDKRRAKLAQDLAKSEKDLEERERLLRMGDTVAAQEHKRGKELGLDKLALEDSDAGKAARQQIHNDVVKGNELSANEQAAGLEKLTERRRAALGKSTRDAKRYLEEEEALAKHHLERSSDTGKNLLNQQEDTRRVSAEESLRDEAELMKRRQELASMSPLKKKEQEEDQARLDRLGILDRDSMHGKQVLAQQAAKHEQEHREALDNTIRGLEEEVKSVTMAADAYQVYRVAKSLGLEDDEDAKKRIFDEQDKARLERAKQSVAMPGQKEFEEQLERIARWKKRGDITTDQAALLLNDAEKKFAPETWRASFSGVADTWTRMQTSAASPQDKQLKATQDLARILELKYLNADEQRKLLEAIPKAIEKINGQRP